MKRIISIISLMMLLVSCGEKENTGSGSTESTFEEKFCKEWHSCDLAMENADIYINFSEDRTFELYQKIGEGTHRLYRGTWNLTGNILSGKYNDGEDWAASYEVTMSDKFMVMTSRNDAAEENIFEDCAIPDEVRNTCKVVVRSSGHTDFRPVI